MNAARGQRLLFRATVGLGFGALVLAATQSAAASLSVLALGAAAVIITELVQVSGDDNSLDPVDSQPFSFASPTHLALVVIAGVWPAALLAGIGVVVVDLLRGSPRRAVAFNAAVFALATSGGGAAFTLAGGTPGVLVLPGDLPAYGLLTLTYVLVNLTLVNAMAALSAGGQPLSEVRHVLRTDPSSRAAESGLGLMLAFAVLSEPWALVACGPLVVAVYRAYERHAILRRETARALETFANVVDERDPSTYRHSARVADYVESLGRALGLPSAQVARLRWAGRLHDLGKIAVDSSVLEKPGRLSPAEQEAMRRHPRLSARMLRRFRFAASEARAVEYHHERHDGHGYYGVGSDDLPLAAAFLVVADSYDAMTSDRAYRRALSAEEALDEIERGAGTQFHPLLARAFVALQRGLDPQTVLTEQERRELRRPARRRHVSFRAVAPEIVSAFRLIVAGLATSLLAVGAGHPLLAVPGGLAALGGLGWRQLDARRATRLTKRLRGELAAAPTAAAAFGSAARALAEAAQLEWAGLVRRRVEDSSGRTELQWHGGRCTPPRDDMLASWLLRDADSGELLVADGAELGVPGKLVGFPLAAEASFSEVWLVLQLRRARAEWVDQALLGVRDELAFALAPAAPEPGIVLVPAAAAL